MIFGKQLANATVTLAKLAADVTNLIASKLPLDGSAPMTGALDMNGQRIVGLGAPTASGDAVRLQDLQAMPWKEKCYAATKGNIDLATQGTNGTNIDLTGGNALSLGKRVLVWMQAIPAQNGIYIVNSSAWTRAYDADTNTDLAAAMVTVEQGDLFGDHRFAQTAEIATLGTDAVTFVDIGTGAPAGFPTTANKGMTASLTTADGQVACATAVVTTPIQGSYVQVLLNGVAVRVADGALGTDIVCYFSPDGVQIRGYTGVVAGDALYWVGSEAGFELAASDTFDFNYLV